MSIFYFQTLSGGCQSAAVLWGRSMNLCRYSHSYTRSVDTRGCSSTTTRLCVNHWTYGNTTSTSMSHTTSSSSLQNSEVRTSCIVRITSSLQRTSCMYIVAWSSSLQFRGKNLIYCSLLQSSELWHFRSEFRGKIFVYFNFKQFSAMTTYCSKSHQNAEVKTLCILITSFSQRDSEATTSYAVVSVYYAILDQWTFKSEETISVSRK